MKRFIRDSTLGFLSVTALGVMVFNIFLQSRIADAVLKKDVDQAAFNVAELVVQTQFAILVLALCLSVGGVGLIRVAKWENKNWEEARHKKRNEKALFAFKRIAILIGAWILAAFSVGRVTGYW